MNVDDALVVSLVAGEAAVHAREGQIRGRTWVAVAATTYGPARIRIVAGAVADHYVGSGDASGVGTLFGARAGAGRYQSVSPNDSRPALGDPVGMQREGGPDVVGLRWWESSGEVGNLAIRG